MFWNNMLWGNTYSQYALLIVYIVAAFFVGKIFYFISSKIIKSFTAKTKTKLDDILVHLLERPILFIIILTGAYFGIHQLTILGNTQALIDKIVSILFTLNISWIIINLIDAFIVNYIKPLTERSKSDLDDHLVPIISKIIKIILWVVVLIMIIKRFGFDISALVTGVGIGGLAFALAAQDLLSNLFGGIAILSDKPFKIGDRIKIGQNDGWIREIGLRTTRMETLDGTQLIIPNSDIAKSVLENISREKARKVKLTVGITYDTPTKKVIKAQKIIHDVVRDHKLTENESIAALSEFGDSALVIMIIYWIREKNVDNLMDIRNEINLEIKEEFEKAGISMAFPTRTVHIVSESKKRVK